MSNESFILKVTCNFPPLLEVIQKNFYYVNELFKFYPNPLYIELIQNGFLIVMQNFNLFREFEKNHLLEEKAQLICSEMDNNEDWKKDQLAEFEFPEEGVYIWYESETIPNETIVSYLEMNFAQIDPCIETEIQKSGRISVHFPNQKCFILYCRVQYLNMDELEKTLRIQSETFKNIEEEKSG